MKKAKRKHEIRYKKIKNAEEFKYTPFASEKDYRYWRQVVRLTEKQIFDAKDFDTNNEIFKQ